MKTLSEKSYARVIGLLYLLIAISGGFSIAYVPSIIVGETGAESVQNLSNNTGLFQIGLFADVLVFLFEVVITAMLYNLMKKENKTYSLVAAFSRVGMAIIMGVNLIIYLVPLYLIKSKVLLGDALNSVVDVLFEIHSLGIYVWGLFFGLHLLFLAPMIIKSQWFPTWIGFLMFVGSFGYLTDSIYQLILPQHIVIDIITGVLLALVTIGE